MPCRETRSPFAAFLYELLRDHVLPGTIEKLVQDHEAVMRERPGTIWSLSNRHLAAYAEEVARRLSPGFPAVVNSVGSPGPEDLVVDPDMGEALLLLRVDVQTARELGNLLGRRVSVRLEKTERDPLVGLLADLRLYVEDSAEAEREAEPGMDEDEYAAPDLLRRIDAALKRATKDGR